MNILVRLPNWLGDVVMSLAFLDKLKKDFSAANIEVVIKKGLEGIVNDYPAINAVYTFDKNEYAGLKGTWQFGKKLSAQKKYDLFFCLPDSFSSAVMAFATNAKHRVGYKNEMRSFLLTHSYAKPANIHRVEEYCSLIDFYKYEKYLPASAEPYRITHQPTISHEKYIIVNLNSEAISRRLPVKKSIELITIIQKKFNRPINLTGGPNDKIYINNIYSALSRKDNIENLAGKTSLHQLVALMQNALFVISVDSGPAHIASALNIPLVVIFGAGNEATTGPYKNNKAVVVRNGKLPCEPCVKNFCRLAPLPVCLTELDLNKVLYAIEKLQPNE